MTKSNVVSGKNQSFYKSYFSMTLVIALQNLVVYSVSLADNVMLGGYSELALSGVALCNQIQYFLQMTVMGIGAAMVVLASQFWGKKDTQSVQKIIAVGFWVAVAVSMLLWCAAFFFPHGCLGLLTDDQEVIGEGVKYLKIICFTYVFFGMTNTLLAGLRSVETVRIGFLVSGSTLVINVCLNYLLIYGNFGAPRLGSQGAAIATLTSRYNYIIYIFISIIIFMHVKCKNEMGAYLYNIGIIIFSITMVIIFSLTGVSPMSGFYIDIEDIDDYPEIESILVKREEYVLIVPKNHRLANREEVSLKELKDEYFIAYNDKSSDKRISYSDFMGYTPKISAEPTEASVLSGLVAAGAGIAIIINTPMINTNKISTIKIKEDIGYKSIYIGWNRDSYMTEIRKAFKEYVLSLSEDV